MTPGETVMQFDKKHGSNGIVVGAENGQGFVLYADGSARSRNVMGELIDAEVLTPLARAKNRLKYHEELFRRAKSRFDTEKRMLGETAKAGLRTGMSAPGPEALDKLKELGAAVKQAHAECEKMRQEVVDATPEHVKENERRRLEGIEANQRFLAQLNPITY